VKTNYNTSFYLTLDILHRLEQTDLHYI